MTGLPDFEGKPVAGSKIKVVTSGHGVEFDAAVRVDDIIRVTVEARVSQVDHRVEDSGGDLIRYQTARVITVELTPWDASDTGILRDE